MNYSLDWLLAKYDADEKMKYLYFWGHRVSKDGSTTKSCFSQWWESDFRVEDITYRSAEHWMMAGKARLFEDKEVLDKILLAKSPAEAKKLGRQVRNFVPKVWDDNKYELVVEGNMHKFEQEAPLKEFLINTHERVLVEASPVDNIWGIGMAADNRNIGNPHKWEGENLLGFALMEVRDALK